MSTLAGAAHRDTLLRWFGEDFDHPRDAFVETARPEAVAEEEPVAPAEPVFSQADVDLACAAAEKSWQERQGAKIDEALAEMQQQIRETRTQAWELVEDAARSMCGLLLDELRRMLPGVTEDVSDRQRKELVAAISQALQPELAVEVRIDPHARDGLIDSLEQSGKRVLDGLTITPDETIGQGGVGVTWRRGELRWNAADAVACLEMALRLEPME